jgi:hypothetical protein
MAARAKVQSRSISEEQFNYHAKGYDVDERINPVEDPVNVPFRVLVAWSEMW